MTQSLVELALPDGPVYRSELVDPFVSKIGGRPCWPAGFDLTGLPDLRCGVCASSLFLVLQMDCPWPGAENSFDRIMYVFGCNTRLCTEVHGAKCWKAFVIQKAKASSVKVVAETPKVGLWDTIMAPPVDTSSADKMATEMKALKVTDDEDQDGVYDEKYSVGFPPVKLHIVEEMIQEKASSSSSTKVETIPEPFRVQEGDADWSGEVYESTQLPGYDKYLEKFQKRVSSYPRQCVRFSPTSSPLMFCKESCPLAIGPCLVCGQRRHFELQLMPAILSLLPTCDDAHLSHIPENNRNSHPLFDDGMEWGTVMVYTCGTCQKSPGLIEAAVYVQVETV